MIPFLDSLARAYASRYADSGLLSDFCFVFPNKRAGTFFLKYLREAMPGLQFAPRVTTITDLVADLSGRVVNTRLDTLFLLHRCYCEIISPHLTQKGREEYLSFDSFRRWGETVLSDFNEVDIHLAPADALFRNLFDFRSIASTFLTDDQRQLMEEYFGYRASRQYDDDKFWLEFGERYAEFDNDSASPADDDSPRSRFIHLWKVLSPLYTRFHEALAERGLTTSGGAYRLAAERLQEAAEEGDGAIGRLLPCARLVMVGFNALSMSERRIFSLLKPVPSALIPGEPLTDFIWDSTGPVLADRRNSAGRFVAINRRDFPSPEWTEPWITLSSTTSLPPLIRSVAAPSNVMQVKIAAELISELKEKQGAAPFDDARVAMVLPDEGLLLPLLYSLPESVGETNLTMGYPLKLTAVTSFLTLLRRMQLLRRDSSTYRGYAFEEVRNLLGHPYAHAILGTRRIAEFLAWFENRHIPVVRDSDLQRLGAKGVALLSPIAADATPAQVIGYLDNALSMIESSLCEGGTTSGSHSLDRNIEAANIAAWREALARLDDTIGEYGVRLSVAGTMAEAYRLLQGESVAFEGEPLKGLQIMGMLETRALDFEHLVVVAVNDRTIPRRSRQRSFLPNLLRRAYGLPPVNYAESLFAYYFFRMMSRAREVTLIYDNRVSGFTGGPSRYLHQLDYIYARGKVRHMEYKFRLTARDTPLQSIAKTKETMDRLEEFLSPPSGDGRRSSLSASSLKRYIQCPLKFYLNVVERIGDDPAPSESVDAITYGNIIHMTMEQLLVSDPGRRGHLLDPPLEITAELIDGIISRRGEIESIVRHAINKEYYRLDDTDADRPLPPDTSIIADVAVRQIINILQFDRRLTPFRLYGCEVKGEIGYQLPDGRAVNMTYAIDRIDDAGCDGTMQARIVDYKTGSSHISAPTLDAIFDGSSLSDHYFQLQLYSEFLNIDRSSRGLGPLSLKPVIYPVASIHRDDYRGKEKMVPKIGKTFIEWHDQENLSGDFLGRLDGMLESIFDPQRPFEAAYDADRCRFCAFRSLCRV